ncbi:hypothetical protein [Corynebacterium sp. HS2168-gen11]|uniref:Rv3212 family protein n=1 Tax=Corynebacterium sp. HS2168-gen11 TaxID=2974027 RepID=UPI00216AE9A5|nr:hypothetical protein [Corynebacterium sp. HS2168-gen11]MCS4535828.1 hypothetical protein [Corynebacterium sp. HS2168-gen11]
MSRDRRIAAGLVVVSTLAVAGAWWSAPIRQSHLVPAATAFVEYPAATKAQAAYTEAARYPGDFSNANPVVAGGLVMTVENTDQGSRLQAHHPLTGEVVWEYSRNYQLCSLGTAWDTVVATYRTGVGCGDVVALRANTGQYAYTRSANAPSEALNLESNDRVGTIAPQRLELWRSDLVRTIEYGEVEAKQEPNMQPHEDCTITSAWTRSEDLALTEICDGSLWLRQLQTSPEDSRKPEIAHETELAPQSVVIALSADAVAVYSPGPTPTISRYSTAGELLGSIEVASAPAVTTAEDAVFIAHGGDLPHHITWFDGVRLYILHPLTLEIEHVLDDAVGSPVAVGAEFAYPTAAGIAMASWDTGEKSREIPLDRGGYHGPIGLKLAGDAFVEKQGTTVVTYLPVP